MSSDIEQLQQQQPQQQGANGATQVIEAETVTTLAPRAIVPGLGNVISTFAFVGNSDTNEKTVDIINLHLSTPFPACIQLQPRQSDNRENGFADEFAVQVITTNSRGLRVRIKRLDQNTGWGQNLRLDILIFDQVNNP